MACAAARVAIVLSNVKGVQANRSFAHAVLAFGIGVTSREHACTLVAFIVVLVVEDAGGRKAAVLFNGTSWNTVFKFRQRHRMTPVVGLQFGAFFVGITT